MTSTLLLVPALAIPAVYGLCTWGDWPWRRFHWANTLGFGPILADQLARGAVPGAIVTAAFGVFGIVGLIRGGSSSSS